MKRLLPPKCRLGWLGAFGALLLLAFASCRTASEPRAIELFNGRDLAGWTAAAADPKVAKDRVWSVREGVLVCQGEPVGYLYRGPSVADFRLIVEYRWPGKPGNSGIFSRLTPGSQAIPRTVEVQLHHGDAGDVMGLRGRTIAPEQARFFSIQAHPVAGDIAGVRKLADFEKPPGEWNQVEILAQGGHYTVWVNGKLVNEASGVETLAGPIGLQSEGGLIEFRRVSLTPLGR